MYQSGHDISGNYLLPLCSGQPLADRGNCCATPAVEASGKLIEALTDVTPCLNFVMVVAVALTKIPENPGFSCCRSPPASLPLRRLTARAIRAGACWRFRSADCFNSKRSVFLMHASATLDMGGEDIESCGSAIF